MIAKTLLVLLALSATSVAHAQSYRCRFDLVSVGDSKDTVLKACGEPVRRDQLCERVPADGDQRVVACLDGENWIYKPGYGQFVTTLRFEDGTLVRITYGDRQ